MELENARGTAPSDGFDLQRAWLGAPALPTSHIGQRSHMTVNSCTLAVRRALYAAGRPLRLHELGACTGFCVHEIGSVLRKLVERSHVRKVPNPDGKSRPASYQWIGQVEPKAHQLHHRQAAAD